MIISRIEGGLGNQMFQYAFGAYAALRQRTSLLLDTRSYEGAPAHGYLLDRFCIDAQPATADQLRRVPRKYRLSQRPYRWFDWGSTAFRRHKQPWFGYDPSWRWPSDASYLVGYWQSEKYFPGLRPWLLEQFRLRCPPSPRSQQVADRIDATQSAALHIRRGDYLSDPNAAEIYAQIDWEYYRQAVFHWAAGRDDVEVFVFSNDIRWCRQNVRLPWPVHFVAHNDAATAHEDLWLMSRAMCNVIANSTFSWWSAWLNERPGHSTYAPSNWFRPGTLDDSHIIPECWQRMPARPRLVAA